MDSWEMKMEGWGQILLIMLLVIFSLQWFDQQGQETRDWVNTSFIPIVPWQMQTKYF